MKVAVAGTGYVGLVTGTCLAEKGHHVICVDKDINKIHLMKQGISPIYEKDLEALMQKNFQRGRLDYTDNYKKAYADAEYIIIGVGTPEAKDGSADLSYIYTVAKEIAMSVERDCIIMMKSTVPVGTNAIVEEYIRANLAHPVQIEVVSNPEFLSQGTAVRDTMQASRIVIGTTHASAEQKARALYKPFKVPIMVTTRESAEMIKAAANAFLALKISYINEIANLCEKVGANIEEVSKGMGFDERITPHFLRAGCGYGGACFPKDTEALEALARENGCQLRTVQAAVEVNEKQITRLYEKAKKRMQSFENKTVTILGVTFKPGTDDLRNAPALVNIEKLLKDKAKLQVYDPVGIENCQKIYPTEVMYCSTPEEALQNADICFIFTEWEEIKHLQPQAFQNCMKTPIVYDGRNVYAVEAMQEVEYHSIGRKKRGS